MFVAITKSLLETVGRNIQALHNIEANAKKCPEPPRLTGEEPWLAPVLCGVLHGTDFERHPSLTCGKPRALRFIIESAPGQTAIRTDNEYEFHVPGVPRWVFTDKDGHNTYAPLRIDVTPDTHPGFAAILAWRMSQKEMSRRWEKVREDIVGFLSSAKSLNEALKLWPDVARYVDKDLVAKVNEKTVAKVKPAVSDAMARLAAMDMDAVVSSTVLARLAGAGG